MLLVGWQEGHLACKKTEWWDAGTVMGLGQYPDFHMATLMPLPLTISCSSKSILVYLSGTGSPGSQVVPADKIKEGRKMVICV